MGVLHRTFSEKANENGLVIKLESDAGKPTLLMGDMQDRSAHHGENWLVKQHNDGNIDLNAETLPIGHHGSDKTTKNGYGDTSKGSFLSTVNPDQVVVSSELESEYSHPRDEVLERVEEHGIDVFWTGVHGTIFGSEQMQRSNAEPVPDDEPPDELISTLRFASDQSLLTPFPRVIAPHTNCGDIPFIRSIKRDRRFMSQIMKCGHVVLSRYGGEH
ncbi:hypothetical protein [Halostella pelagica]|uniref:hypothetical protein n=1 Tax=Halostella pelagica TaxID=2583824 RepID=UPI00192A52F7|nr:hypothetical protein [Halostella pelagica]